MVFDAKMIVLLLNNCLLIVEGLQSAKTDLSTNPRVFESARYIEANTETY